MIHRAIPVSATLRKWVIRHPDEGGQGWDDLMESCGEAERRYGRSSGEQDLTNDALGAALRVARRFMRSENGNELRAGRGLLRHGWIKWRPENPKETPYEVRIPKSLTPYVRRTDVFRGRDPDRGTLLTEELRGLSGWDTLSGIVSHVTMKWLLDTIAGAARSGEPQPVINQAMQWRSRYRLAVEENEKRVEAYFAALAEIPFPVALPPYMEISLVSDRPETWGVFCSRHQGGARVLVSTHEDRGYAVAGANTHRHDHPDIPPPLTEEERQKVKDLRISRAHHRMLSEVEEGRLWHNASGFFYPDDMTSGPTGTASSRVAKDLWAAGYLSYTEEAGGQQRHFFVTDSGKERLELFRRARSAGAVTHLGKNEFLRPQAEWRRYPALRTAPDSCWRRYALATESEQHALW